MFHLSLLFTCNSEEKKKGGGGGQSLSKITSQIMAECLYFYLKRSFSSRYFPIFEYFNFSHVS